MRRREGEWGGGGAAEKVGGGREGRGGLFGAKREEGGVEGKRDKSKEWVWGSGRN